VADNPKDRTISSIGCHLIHVCVQICKLNDMGRNSILKSVTLLYGGEVSYSHFKKNFTICGGLSI